MPTRALRSATKYLIATSLALLLVGLLAAFGNRQLSLSPSSAPNFSAYPLPGTPTPRGSGPVATPTRLAAYPLPGASPAPAKPGAPGAPLSFTPVSTSYLPLISKGVGAKGTAGINFYFPDMTRTVGYSNELVMGVNWGYNWNEVFPTDYPSFSSTKTVYDLDYQVVNDVRSKPGWVWDIYFEHCTGNDDPYTTTASYIASPAVQAARQACVAALAHARPGMYWMIWNEPDLGDTSTSDDVNPTLAAHYFKTISDTIKGSDPTARLIVGNVGSVYPPLGDPNYQRFGIYWLSNFVNAYTTTYGIDPRAAIAGYGVHAYSTADGSGLGLSPCGMVLMPTATACLVQHFTTTVLTAVSWVSTTDPNKEVWVTEANWQAGTEPLDTWITQTTRMQQLCDQLPALNVNRYAWFYGLPPYNRDTITTSLFLADLSTSPPIYTGTLSPAGTQFMYCPN